MKDLDPMHAPIPIEQQDERNQEQKYRLLGDLNYKPGLTLYEYDPASKILRRADLQAPPKTHVIEAMPAPKEKAPKGQVLNPEYLLQRHADENKRTVAKVQYKPGCDYFFALNDRSAQKKLDKLMKRGWIR